MNADNAVRKLILRRMAISIACVVALLIGYVVSYLCLREVWEDNGGGALVIAIDFGRFGSADAGIVVGACVINNVPYDATENAIKVEGKMAWNYGGSGLGVIFVPALMVEMHYRVPDA